MNYRGRVQTENNYCMVPIFQNGLFSKHGKAVFLHGLIKGTQALFSCNIVEIYNIEDLSRILEKHGTVKLKSSVFDNTNYSIHITKKVGMEHRLNVFLMRLLKIDIIIKGTLESLLLLRQNNRTVEIKLRKLEIQICGYDN